MKKRLLSATNIKHKNFMLSRDLKITIGIRRKKVARYITLKKWSAFYVAELELGTCALFKPIC